MAKSASIVLPSSEMKVIHLGNQLDFSTSFSSSIGEQSFWGPTILDSLLRTSSSLSLWCPRLRPKLCSFISWLYKEMENLLFLPSHGDRKNSEHGSLSRPWISVELGIPPMLLMRVLECADEESESLLVRFVWRSWEENEDDDDGIALNFLPWRIVVVLGSTSLGTRAATPPIPVPDRVAAHAPCCCLKAKAPFQECGEEEQRLGFGSAFTFRGCSHLLPSESTARKCFTPTTSRISFMFTTERCEHETTTQLAILAKFLKQIQRRNANKITRLTKENSWLEKEKNQLYVLRKIGTS